MSLENPSLGYPLSPSKEEDNQEIAFTSVEIGSWETTPIIVTPAGQSPTYNWMTSIGGHETAVYYDPVNYKIASRLKVLLEVAEKGNLAEEETKNNLKVIIDLNKEIIKYQKELMEHQKEKHIELIAQLANKDELLETRDQIIQTIKEESRVIQKHLELKISDLQGNLLRFIPYKRAFKTSLYFTAFFLGSILCPIIFDIPVMQPLWAWLGLFISAGFLIMSYFMFLEWRKKISGGKNYTEDY